MIWTGRCARLHAAAIAACWALAAGPVDAAEKMEDTTAARAIDFGRDIRPIFEKHCRQCHNSDKHDGNLRLDACQFLLQGGDSHQNLLGLPIAGNELVRRITCENAGERMPLGAPKLDEESIRAIILWIEQGGVWPAPQTEDTRLFAQRSFWERMLTGVLDRYEAWHGPVLAPALYWFLGVGVSALLLARARAIKAKQLAGGEPLSRWVAIVARVSWGYPLSLALAAAFYGSMLLSADLHRELTKSRADVAHLQAKLHPARGDAPRLRPKHPPRMGGEYYRGNNERHAQLFNGGFYRTCTFRVHLVGSDDLPLQWGSTLPAGPALRLEIEQSPFATPALFSEQIMGKVGLVAVPPDKLPASSTARHELVKTGPQPGTWIARYPLFVDDRPACEGAHEGMLFLYRDLTSTNGQLQGECHYSIGYRFFVKDGKLTPESEVWMESVYNGIAIRWPTANELTPEQWFDFRPIPEIERGNTSDPKLLGVVDHLPELKQVTPEPPLDVSK